MKNLTDGKNDKTATKYIDVYIEVEIALILSFENILPITMPTKVQNYILRRVIVRKFYRFVYFLSSLGSELERSIFTYCIAKM